MQGQRLVPFGGDNAVTASLQELGLRGRRIIELASLNASIHIAPGFIIDNELLKDIVESQKSPKNNTTTTNNTITIDVEDLLDRALSGVEKIMEKRFGEGDSPLLLKVAESPMLNLVDTTATAHNIGLNDSTVEGFGVHVGKQFAWREYANMVRRVLRLQLKNKPLNSRGTKIRAVTDQLNAAYEVDEARGAIDATRKLLPQSFFSNAYEQLLYVIELFHNNFAGTNTSSDSCVLIQSMVFGNYGTRGGYGSFYTRDPIRGQDALSGFYFQGSFDIQKAQGTKIPIHKVEPKIRDTLEKLSLALENHFKEIRKVVFTVENGQLWIIDQQAVPLKSARAELATLLALQKRHVVDKAYVVSNFSTPRLSELLHPSLDARSVKGFVKIEGGISGAIGAAMGQVYFNADRLIEAQRLAHQQGLQADFILAMPATYAEDVKGIEASNGVITCEGGYASHAPVVARSLGKVAMVNPDIRFKERSMHIAGKTIKEGDYITLQVPYQDKPSLFLGGASLIPSDPKESNLAEFIVLTNEFIDKVYVRANADLPTDAEMALLFGAQGIGLCRTEHMFFNTKRINTFRSMIIAENIKERRKALATLEKFQTEDFYSLFKIMRGYPVTIRLLDAPLHEFLPHSSETMEEFIGFFRKRFPHVSPGEIRNRCNLLAESNPMLGHRGVRLAISYPEIYRMQLRAIFQAAFRLHAEGIKVEPEIMIPLIMNPHEIKAIRNGKRIEGNSINGIKDIEREVRSETNQKTSINYTVGAMIELPAAALLADKIASYAQFFSFGTNDLTQTTHGLSRDDFNSFFTVYNEFDLLEDNPFKTLSESVQELIEVAAERGRLVRPNIKLGLCGEHGAEPVNIPFALSVGLDYISCSPFGVPMALLSIAQSNIARQRSTSDN